MLVAFGLHLTLYKNLRFMKKCIALFSLQLIFFFAVAQPTINIQAHRGGAGLMPENTIAAMLHAVQLGARTLEIDCVIAADYNVVVSHDYYMSADFMLKPDGSVISKEEEKQYNLYHMMYDSIKTFDAGTKINPRKPLQQKFKTYKPLLADLIDSVEHYVTTNFLKPVYYNIEIKSSAPTDTIYHPKPEVFVKLVMDVITHNNIQDRVNIQSFDVRPLQVMHQHYPSIPLSYLVESKSVETNLEQLGFTPAIYSPYYLLVTKSMVNKVHQQHMQLIPWTVNTEAAMKKLAALKVDGIITDFPDKGVQLFGSYQQNKSIK